MPLKQCPGSRSRLQIASNSYAGYGAHPTDNVTFEYVIVEHVLELSYNYFFP